MSSISGSFSGRITVQSSLPLSDQPNHLLGIAEVTGTQNSADPLWQNSTITYWGVTDLLDGKGTQKGYFNNDHPDGGRDYGTFEGQVTMLGEQMTVEGTYKFTGGDGKYRGISGSGKFKTVAKSETQVEAKWEGQYQLAQTTTA